MIRLLQIAVFVAFGLLWEIASRTFADPFYISSPVRVAQVLTTDLQNAGFWRDLGITFRELLLGYVFGAAGGIATAVVFGRWPRVAQVFDPFLAARDFKRVDLSRYKRVPSDRCRTRSRRSSASPLRHTY